MIYALLVGHFVGDWLLQSDWMAINKSKRWDALSVHCAVVTAVLGVFTYAVASSLVGWILFVLVNGVLHFATDAVTSRITSSLWFIKLQSADVLMCERDDQPTHVLLAEIGTTRHWFFVVIGADQLIHYTTLVLTAGIWL